MELLQRYLLLVSVNGILVLVLLVCFLQLGLRVAQRVLCLLTLF